VQIINALEPLREAVGAIRSGKPGGKVALVPTMGALHAGHIALITAARAQADAVVASIFVNPRQFGANEDLAAYPRQLARDAEMLAAAGCDVLWAPDAAAMYPAGYATNISVSGVSEGLCGGARPGHFDGVATVVCKLFNQVRPDLALFGEKDWQQLAVIRRMARDLDLSQPHVDQIIGVPTIREADDLAMSSRNAYLTAQERAAAAALPAAMRAAIARIEAGAPVAEALADLTAQLRTGGFASIDYAELRDAETLAPLTAASTPARLLVAARIGKARLIDNMAVAALTTG